jgi:hypothetical protein
LRCEVEKRKVPPACSHNEEKLVLAHGRRDDVVFKVPGQHPGRIYHAVVLRGAGLMASWRRLLSMNPSGSTEETARIMGARLLEPLCGA